MTNPPVLPTADAPTATDRTFEFLLNAFEQASQSSRPAEHDYATKRKAIFTYVASLLAADADRQRMDAFATDKDWNLFETSPGCWYVIRGVFGSQVSYRGDGYDECDDPMECCKKHLGGSWDHDCPCSACGGTGLAKHQRIW